MSYTKEEFYKAFIQTQKLTGQGTSGIVKVAGGPTISKILDDLIEEGLCVAENTGGSIGHPEASIFYMPTKGYNVWREQNSMTSLECVRYYISKQKGERYEGDRFLKIDKTSFEEGGQLYEFYNEWLERNREELDVMMNLSEVYPN